ncbi:MAG: GldM family protein [Flavobacteriaceae bacterium]
MVLPLKEDGQNFLDEMNTYRNEFARIASNDPKLASIGEEVLSKFSTEKVQPVQGKALEYLDYHFKGFPLIASITKMTLLQSSIKNIEAQLLSTMLEGKLKIEASLTNFDAIVISDKSSFFAGENFTGRIILGKNDKTLKADKVIINGVELGEEAMQEGQTLLKFPAGGIGSKKIQGEFQFREEGEVISIDVSSSYEVVPRPNKATISADKMNVVYNGVSNPFTISFPGIDANKVSVNTPGLKKGKTIIEKGRKKKLTGASDYELDLSELPPQLRGKKQVLINVTGTLPSGQKVTSKIPFRIKSLPIPYGTLDRLKPKSVKKSELMSSMVTATFGEDFDFDLPLRVRGFKITVAGIGSRVVSGNELDGQAKSLVQRARNNTIVTITDIKTRAIGSTTEIKEATDVSFSLVN